VNLEFRDIECILVSSIGKAMHMAYGLPLQVRKSIHVNRCTRLTSPMNVESGRYALVEKILNWYVPLPKHISILSKSVRKID
jgi:hypothetical protein